MQKNVKEQSEKIKLEIRQQRKEEKEMLIADCIDDINSDFPLLPEDLAYEVSRAYIEGKNEIKRITEKSGISYNQEFAIYGELNDCLVNDGDISKIARMTFEEKQSLYKKLAAGELTIDCTSNGEDITLEFKKSPDKEKINENYRKYKAPLTREEMKEIACKVCPPNGSDYIQRRNALMKTISKDEGYLRELIGPRTGKLKTEILCYLIAKEINKLNLNQEQAKKLIDEIAEKSMKLIEANVAAES